MTRRAEDETSHAAKRVEQLKSVDLEADILMLMQDTVVEVQQRAVTAMHNFKCGRPG